MTMLIGIGSALFIIYGIGLFFASGAGTFIASIVCIASGVLAWDDKSLVPLAVGFGILWLLRLMGFEKI